MAFTPSSSQRFVPTTGQTITPLNSSTDIIIVLDPAGLLAALTVGTPSAPFDGQRFTVMTTMAITALTLAVGTVIGGPSALVANSFWTVVWNASQSKWYRIG